MLQATLACHLFAIDFAASAARYGVVYSELYVITVELDTIGAHNVQKVADGAHLQKTILSPPRRCITIMKSLQTLA